MRRMRRDHITHLLKRVWILPAEQWVVLYIIFEGKWAVKVEITELAFGMRMTGNTNH